MAGFHVHDGRLFVDGISCEDIAQACGTPCYIYSAQRIARQYLLLNDTVSAHWRGAGKPSIAFACKANSNLAVLRLLGSLGAGADVVSGGEIERALAAGIAPDRIVFSGVGKTRDELNLALQRGIAQINIETAGELDILLEDAPAHNVCPRVAFRYTPGVEAATHAKISTGEDDHKFGLLEEEILSLYARASASGKVEPVGISVHIGSQIFNLDAFEQAYGKVISLITKLRENGHAVTSVDLGGGFGVPYQEDQAEFDTGGYARLIDRMFSGLGVSLLLEPGRFLVAEAGALLTRVTYVKDRPDRRFVIIDAGMNDLIRPTLYEAWHTIVPVTPVDGTPTPADIVGPVCETGDYFALGRPLPPVQPGDLLAVLCAGAYGAAMSSQYNSRPLIPEILVGEDGRWDVVRRRQEIPEIWALENIPGWLK